MPIYMKYEGIEGTSTGRYRGWIELKSCQLGYRRSTNPKSISEIFVTKVQDGASALLAREALSGEGKKVTIDFVSSAGCAPYLSIELENTLISSYRVSDLNSDRPMESLSLNFTKISYTNTPTECAKDPQAVKDKAMWNLAIK